MANEGQWQFQSQSVPMVEVQVNGEDMGEVGANEKLGDVVQRFARESGILTAVVYSGDRKLGASEGGKTFQELGVTSIDVRTKDARA